jgi:hypothetical protein
MNKLFIAIILAYLSIKLLSSWATKGLYEDSLNMESGSHISNDMVDINVPVRINAFPLNIFPPSSGVQFYRDGIVFLSLTKNEGKMLPGHLSFGTVQAYYAPIEDTTLGQHVVFSPTVSFPYPCEALSFNDDFRSMYFTRKSERDRREKIYHAELSSGKAQKGWKMDTKPLYFCTESSIYSHPSVSVDGSLMIFASDNPESVGGMDLFITKKESGNWTKPENLGAIVNTKGNELFPFLDKENNLYYSSNGHPGNGGYDIFISKFNGKGWDRSVRFSKYFNTNNDEVAFTIDRKFEKSAFFTRKKNNRNNETQLYRVSLNEKLLTKDNTNLPSVLYEMALAEIDSGEIRIAAKRLEAERMKADSIEAARLNALRLESEKNKTEKLRADSILLVNRKEAERLEAERIKAAKLRADSIMAARKEAERLEAERIKAARLRDDSIMAARKEAERIEAERIKAAKLRADSIEAARLEENKKVNPDIVIYKVQFLSTVKPKEKLDISVDGKVYSPFEYFYLGEYRYTIGEFSTLEPAVELQNACRKSGYPQAFVVAFKNNVRSTDPGLFK